MKGRAPDLHDGNHAWQRFLPDDLLVISELIRCYRTATPAPVMTYAGMPDAGDRADLIAYVLNAVK
jgi:hypothetical protein